MCIYIHVYKCACVYTYMYVTMIIKRSQRWRGWRSPGGAGEERVWGGNDVNTELDTLLFSVPVILENIFSLSSTNKNGSPTPWNGADLHYWVQLYPDSAKCDNLIHAELQLTLGKNILKRKKKKKLLTCSTSNLCLPWDDREKMKYDTKSYWIHLPQMAFLSWPFRVNPSECVTLQSSPMMWQRWLTHIHSTVKMRIK